MRRIIKKIGFIACFIFLVPIIGSTQEAEIQTNSITTNLGLYGGYPEDIAIDYGTDYVYIANFAPNGLFYSHDTGETWLGLPDSADFGSGKAVEVDQNNSDVYAIIGDSLVKSTDYGVTFTDISSHTTDQNFGSALAVVNGQVLIGLNDGAVIYSIDAGTSFTRASIETGSTVNFIAASPTTNTFYATTENGGISDSLYKTEDGGATWTNMDVYSKGVVSGGRFLRVGVDPLNAGHLILTSHISDNYNYQSFDAGATWVVLTNNSQSINSGYVEWDGAGRMYTSSIYTDNAAADPVVWTQISTTTPASSIYRDILAVDREGDHVMYTDSALGVAKSIDQGVTWTDQINGVTSVKSYAVSQASDKNIVWVGTRGGLARTTNFTEIVPTWQYPIVPDQTQSNWMGVWINPSNANHIVAAAGSNFYYTDNGQDASPTWIKATSPSATSTQVQQIIADPDDSNILYSAFSYDNLNGSDTGYVVKSLDSGVTWTDLNFAVAGVGAIALTTDKILFAGITGDAAETGLYKFDGTTWTKTTTEFDTLEIASLLADPADANILYLTADAYPSGGGLYKSEDQGATWTQITVDDNINHIDTLTIQTSTEPDTIYVAGQDGTTLKGVIYKTSDGGETWGLLYTGLKHESFYTLLFDGLLVGNDRGLYEIKSKSSLSLKVNNESKKSIKVTKGTSIKIKSVLKDAATEKVLKHKKIKIYRKIKSNNWKLYKKITTNQKGAIKTTTVVNRLTQFKVKWSPSVSNAEEYAGDVSRIVKIKVK